MANFRRAKAELKKMLEQSDWRAHLPGIAAGGLGNVGALFSFLLYGPQMMHRAAQALGATVASIYDREPEAARNIIRRFMWHMNEDSGNIGWGIPAAFGETLAQSPGLAKSYANILTSYIMDLGFADNYCDQAALRRECYWAIGCLAQAQPRLMEKARPWLLKGLHDEDSICRGMAAWALGQLPGDFMDAPALGQLANAGNNDICEVFDSGEMRSETVSGWARIALAKI